MTVSGGTRAGAAIALAAAGLLIVAGCRDGGGDRAPDEAAFEAAMIEEYGATAVQAECIAGYVLEEYDSAEVATIQTEGIDQLPLGRWDAYFHTVIACLNQPPVEG